jgi:hypothetical protein
MADLDALAAKYGGTVSSATAQSPASPPSANSLGYDFSTYATDPDYTKKLTSVKSRIPDVNTPEQIDSYIKSVAPDSPISGKDIAAASKATGVDSKTLLSVFTLESQLGTKGAGAKTNNPGNVGNEDSGKTRTFSDVGAGILASANEIARRKIPDSGQATTPTTPTAPASSNSNTASGTPDLDALAAKYGGQRVQTFGDKATEFAKGFGKQAASSAVDMGGQFLQHMVGRGLPLSTSDISTLVPPINKAQENYQSFVTPSNPQQSAGATTEKIAELLPLLFSGANAARIGVAKVAGAANEAATGMLPKAAEMLTSRPGAAITGAIEAAIRSGGDPIQILRDAAVGFGVGGEAGVGGVVTRWLKKNAAKAAEAAAQAAKDKISARTGELLTEGIKPATTAASTAGEAASSVESQPDIVDSFLNLVRAKKASPPSSVTTTTEPLTGPTTSVGKGTAPGPQQGLSFPKGATESDAKQAAQTFESEAQGTTAQTTTPTPQGKPQFSSEQETIDALTSGKMTGSPMSASEAQARLGAFKRALAQGKPQSEALQAFEGVNPGAPKPTPTPNPRAVLTGGKPSPNPPTLNEDDFETTLQKSIAANEAKLPKKSTFDQLSDWEKRILTTDKDSKAFINAMSLEDAKTSALRKAYALGESSSATEYIPIEKKPYSPQTSPTDKGTPSEDLVGSARETPPAPQQVTVSDAEVEKALQDSLPRLEKPLPKRGSYVPRPKTELGLDDPSLTGIGEKGISKAIREDADNPVYLKVKEVMRKSLIDSKTNTVNDPTSFGPFEETPFGKQALIPGTLDAAVSGPARPLTPDPRLSKPPDSTFRDQPLFSKEADDKAAAEAAKFKNAQIPLKVSDLGDPATTVARLRDLAKQPGQKDAITAAVKAQFAAEGKQVQKNILDLVFADIANA